MSRKLLLLLGLVLLFLAVAVPVQGAEAFIMTCHRCDQVDVSGKGLDANATLPIAIRDVRTGQRVIPNPTFVKTDQLGNFSHSFPVDLGRHPSLEGAVYNKGGTELVLAAHSRFTAPLMCKEMASSLPFTGSRISLLGALGTGALLLGGLLLAATRRRAGHLVR